MASEGGETEIGGRYSQYVLGVLVLVYIANFLDRQIISILSVKIQEDLGIDDADIGFLYGTAFAVFYAIFGIPLGRLADVWTRRTLISVGLAFWSAATACSGLAQNLTQLALARIGVGVGEASATPAAYSMLSDSFPASRRATVIAIYSSGVYLGAGLGLFLGGTISSHWDAAYATAPAPFDLRGWQVAFMAVGTPGLLIAAWVRTLREPVRGAVDGIFTPEEPHPFRVFGRELRAVLPGFTIFHLLRSGAGASGVALNLAAAGIAALLALFLTRLTGDTAQWVALAIGLYAATSWGQALRLRDPPSFSLIFRTRTLILCGLGFSFLAFSGYGTGFWGPPYAIRVLGIDEASAGLWLGGLSALGGFLGVTLGGLLADRLRLESRRGRLYVGLLGSALPMPFFFWQFNTQSLGLFYGLSLVTGILSAMWIGAGASTMQDLVLPRMRATAAAAYLLVITFVGLALGPYTIGRISVATGDLRTGILSSLVVNVLAFGLLLAAARSLERDEDSLRERAAAAGESV